MEGLIRKTLSKALFLNNMACVTDLFRWWKDKKETLEKLREEAFARKLLFEGRVSRVKASITATHADELYEMSLSIANFEAMLESMQIEIADIEAELVKRIKLTHAHAITIPSHDGILEYSISADAKGDLVELVVCIS